MTTSVAIMAHPSRAPFVEELEPLLPGAEVVWDQKNNRWDTGRRAMLAFDSGASHHLVVQDDAILCPDFVEGVEEALAAVPANSPAAFYMGRVRPADGLVRALVERAVAQSKAWVAMKGPWWGVAVAVPTSVIPLMIEWCDKRFDIANYDRRMSRFFESIDQDCWYSVPSLADHRIGEENPSLVPGRGATSGRTAHLYIGDESALSVDWTRGAVNRRDLDLLSEATSTAAARRDPMKIRVTNRRNHALSRGGLTFQPGCDEVVSCTGQQYKEIKACSGLLILERQADGPSQSPVSAGGFAAGELSEQPKAKGAGKKAPAKKAAAKPSSVDLDTASAEDVAGKNMATIRQWVEHKDTAERAAALTELEQDASSPRSTLLAWLEQVAERGQQPSDDASQSPDGVPAGAA